MFIIKSLGEFVKREGKFMPYQLDFDYVRGNKISTIPNMIRRFGKEKILEEIAKCDLVCANYHRIRTCNKQIKEVV